MNRIFLVLGALAPLFFVQQASGQGLSHLIGPALSIANTAALNTRRTKDDEYPEVIKLYLAQTKNDDSVGSSNFNCAAVALGDCVLTTGVCFADTRFVNLYASYPDNTRLKIDRETAKMSPGTEGHIEGEVVMLKLPEPAKASYTPDIIASEDPKVAENMETLLSNEADLFTNRAEALKQAERLIAVAFGTYLDGETLQKAKSMAREDLKQLQIDKYLESYLEHNKNVGVVGYAGPLKGFQKRALTDHVLLPAYAVLQKDDRGAVLYKKGADGMAKIWGFATDGRTATQRKTADDTADLYHYATAMSIVPHKKWIEEQFEAMKCGGETTPLESLDEVSKPKAD